MGKTSGDLSIGVEYNHVSDVKEKLDLIMDKGANYICSRLVPKIASETCVETGLPIPCKEYWNDTILNSKEWALGVVAALPNPPQLESEDTMVQQRAMKALNRQIEYCNHLSISAIMFELDSPSNHLAQMIQSRLNQSSQHFTFWVKVKYGSPGSGSDEDWDETTDTWKMFNTFRKLCGAERKLLAVLQLNADIPSEGYVLDRWKGEMVTAVSVPLSIFLTNNSGFPVLSKSHQAVLETFFAIGVHVILEVDTASENVDLQPYTKYLRYLHTREADPAKSSLHDFRTYVQGYENYLQCPLQPLMDNLEYQTYATFERDPVKYVLYRDAISLAMRKKLPTKELRESTILVIVVAGAGRGPLVTMSLEAAKTEEVNVRMYCLEKNPSAEVRLRYLNETEWEGKVTIVCDDMRCWNPPEKADIIVSELLGSFGDNELSPECLDGAQRFLKSDGIIIPQEYTSSLAPVMTHTLFAEASKYRESERPYDSPYETTYVCYMTRKYDIAKPKDLFKFEHPYPLSFDKETWSNDRYKTLEFEVAQDCDCHGFAGYFDSVLFRSDDGTNEVRMSIHPDTYSEGMHSWFPLYIPIKAGISLKKGDKLVVNFWRRSTSTKVWYEWTVVSPTALPIHNVNGRSSYLGLDLARTE